MRADRYAETPELPIILGVEAAGIVEAVGPGSRCFPTGQACRRAAVHVEKAVWRLCRLCDDRCASRCAVARGSGFRSGDGADGAGPDGTASAPGKSTAG
ncbi:alcohol dehydrogenase catalytic domain-containing protein [Aminobacter sp. UC22_36]|uniref:alcohol dehydrogenase catalytic domain-containing protein n=1 Tax=Aminobacter sp. UC22_36 TaxID=3374549 RepID=UPI0037574CF1